MMKMVMILESLIQLIRKYLFPQPVNAVLLILFNKNEAKYCVLNPL